MYRSPNRTSSYLKDPSQRTISAGQIQDAGLRDLLSKDVGFSSPNKYQKLGVAPIGALQAAASKYNVLDTSALDFDQFKPVFEQYAAGKGNQGLFITPEQMEKAKTDLGSRYSILDADTQSKFSALPEFQGLKALGTKGGNTLYESGALKSVQDTIGNKYGFMNESALEPYKAFSEFSSLKPVTTIGGQMVFNKSDINAINDQVGRNYATLTPEQIASAQGDAAFAALKPITTMGGNSVYRRSDVDAYNQRGDQRRAEFESKLSPYYSGIRGDAIIKPITGRGGNPVYGANQSRGWDLPLDLSQGYGPLQQQAQARAIQDAKNFAAYGFRQGEAPSGWEHRKLMQTKSGYMDTSKLSPDNPNYMKGFDAWNESGVDTMSGQKYLKWDPESGYSWALYPKAMSSSEAWKDDLEGIALVGSIIGGIVLPGLGTSWAGLAGSGANALSGGAVSSLPALSTASLGASSAVAPFLDAAIGNALTSGLSSKISGGDFWKGALAGGVTGGLGALGSAAIPGLTSNPVMSNLARMGLSSGLGGLGSYLGGGDFKTGALGGALTGGLGAVGRLGSQAFGPQFGTLANFMGPRLASAVMPRRTQRRTPQRTGVA